MKSTTLTASNTKPGRHFTIKDPASAFTHFIGMLMALFAALPLLLKASRNPEPVHLVSLGICIASMFLLYLASTLFHTLNLSPKVNRFLKKMDHLMIFVLIAGSYTPVCLIALRGVQGFTLLALVWGIAIVGIVVKMLWINCPKWFSSVLYIAMGWLCVLSFSQIVAALSGPAFWWLLVGGIIYTVGGVIYALKLPFFNARHPFFGTHEIFHLFVMGGSLCHFILMYNYLSVMPLH